MAELFCLTAVLTTSRSFRNASDANCEAYPKFLSATKTKILSLFHPSDSFIAYFKGFIVIFF